MTDKPFVSRKDKLIEVDTNRENLYNLCIDNALTQKEIGTIMQLSMFKIKTYVSQLVRENHMEKIKFKNSTTNHNVIKFISTETAYKPRSNEELDEYILSGKTSLKKPKKWLYDDLIASNPNLRKICLFDTKKTSDFLGAQRLKVNRSVSSSWSMFESI